MIRAKFGSTSFSVIEGLSENSLGNYSPSYGRLITDTTACFLLGKSWDCSPFVWGVAGNVMGA